MQALANNKQWHKMSCLWCNKHINHNNANVNACDSREEVQWAKRRIVRITLINLLFCISLIDILIHSGSWPGHPVIHIKYRHQIFMLAWLATSALIFFCWAVCPVQLMARQLALKRNCAVLRQLFVDHELLFPIFCILFSPNKPNFFSRGVLGTWIISTTILLVCMALTL